MYIWSKYVNLETIRKYHNRYARFLILFFLGGMVLLGANYALKKSDIRNRVLKEIRSGIAPEQLVHFQFSSTEALQLNWKKSHEFELNGEMYDIVETKKVDGTVYYSCFHDTKESKLNRQLYKFLSQFISTDKDSNSEGQKTTSIQKVYFNTYPSNEMVSIILSFEPRLAPLYLSIYDSQYVNISCPPPELV
ncbi:MAG: hypothetical protein AB8B74_13965 [Crocinitomicaceae bacterium]